MFNIEIVYTIYHIDRAMESAFNGDPNDDPNIRDEYGKTSLMNASNKGHIEKVKLLLDKGADPNIVSPFGITALMDATHNDHTDIVELLLDNGADIDFVSPFGKTALIGASIIGYRDIVELLLDRDSNPNIRDYNGVTALMCASGGHIEIVELLLAKGSDPNIVDKFGGTALMWVTDCGHTDIVKVINDHIALQNALQNLAFAKSMNSLTPSLKCLDYDIMQEIMNCTRTYNHGVKMRMKV